MKTLTRRIGKSWIEILALLDEAERATLPLVEQTRRDPQYCGTGWAGWSTVSPRRGYFGVLKSDKAIWVYFAPSLEREEGEAITGYGYSSGPSLSRLEIKDFLGKLAEAEKSFLLSREEFDNLPIVYRREALAYPTVEGMAEGTKFRFVAEYEKEDVSRYQIWEVGGDGQPQFLGEAIVPEGEVEERNFL